jgi:hypothetical protein
MNLIFVNGYVNNNPAFVLYKNDFIQLPVNLSFFVSLFSTEFGKNKKFKFLSQFKISHLHSKSLNFKTLKKLSLPVADNPLSFELDFFSLSIFILENKFFQINSPNPYFFQSNTSILNMYN